jgi:hypothetical protein
VAHRLGFSVTAAGYLKLGNGDWEFWGRYINLGSHVLWWEIALYLPSSLHDRFLQAIITIYSMLDSVVLDTYRRSLPALKLAKLRLRVIYPLAFLYFLPMYSL